MEGLQKIIKDVGEAEAKALRAMEQVILTMPTLLCQPSLTYRVRGNNKATRLNLLSGPWLMRAC